MASELRVDKIIPTTGAPTGGGGGGIQIQYTHSKHHDQLVPYKHNLSFINTC